MKRITVSMKKVIIGYYFYDIQFLAAGDILERNFGQTLLLGLQINHINKAGQFERFIKQMRSIVFYYDFFLNILNYYILISI